MSQKTFDGHTEALAGLVGENQVNYRYFVGFKLILNEKEVSLKNIWSELVAGFGDFVHSANNKLISDFTTISNNEIDRFKKMEYLLENKLTRRFKVRNVYPKDIVYILEYLHGQSGIPYEEYDYPLPKKIQPSSYDMTF